MREELVTGLFTYLDAERLKSTNNCESKANDRELLEETLRSTRVEQSNLLRAIAAAGHSKALLDALASVEARTVRLEELLIPSVEVPVPQISEEQVRSFVSKQSFRFAEILSSEPETLRHELQKRISSLIMNPTTVAGKTHYLVSGDINLFSGCDPALQSNQGDWIALQYKVPIRVQLPTHQLAPRLAA